MIFRLGVLLFSLLLAACGKEPLYHEQGYVFGTLVDVSIYGLNEPEARQAAGLVLREFQRMNDQFHAWQPSELSRLNAAFARGEHASVSPELAAMLADATRYSVQSGGLFNPAIGGLIRHWGFQSDEFKPQLPEVAEVSALVKANPQMADLVLAHGKVWSRNSTVQIDLGGYAKGYALDRAAALLRERGVRHALINIGGNILALGKHGDRLWRVGIQHPRKAGPLATLELHDGEAIGTSGDYQRYFELAGKRYCHLIDPRDGLPKQGVQAVTVLTRGLHAGVDSDVLSKPLFIAGTTTWVGVAKQMQVTEAMLIDSQGRIHLTAAMQKRLEFTAKQTPEVVP
ncbi:MAG: FAD:protein FMN transferase [Gallionella sp.]|nr:FAD:protein FMN transferase [Gallionella sp.]